MSRPVCTCPIVVHTAIGLIFEAGTYREIRRSSDCLVHRCAPCEGRGYVVDRGEQEICSYCEGSGIRDDA